MNDCGADLACCVFSGDWGSMPSLKDFVAALQAGWFPALAAFIGCAIVLLGDYFRWPYLDGSPAYLLTIAVYVGVFSFSVLTANLAYMPVLIWNIYSDRRAKERFFKRIEKEIEEAPSAERELLSYLVSSGRRAFTSEFDDKRLVPLVSKGLIIRQGGQHSVLDWPFVVRQEVWDYLTEHKERFEISDLTNVEDPFRKNGWLI
ncbi:hypothetical protein J3R80_12810 [Aliiroseovarius sp. Z3]|uniref:hypothetical protein n=1 Tax=Aliiroseovarius sp. Z3 TaxID=2811402 RepID=UPI0023B301FE|nr:hypothetical protein [Aliiroseovarius sp. Z3]MDE9451349.1 hypothetical protein [Aliiroseovarius sp. Z3]